MTPSLCRFSSFATRRADPLVGLGEHFAFGRADVLRLLLPLAIDLRLLVAHVLDEHPFPQALVKILQPLDFLPFDSQRPWRSARPFASPAASRARRPSRFPCPRNRSAVCADLRQPLLVQRDVEAPLNPLLHVIVGGTRTNQHDLQHVSSELKSHALPLSPRTCADRASRSISLDEAAVIVLGKQRGAGDENVGAGLGARADRVER